MARLKQRGREMIVPDTDVAEYLRKGYSVIDDHGNEITPGTPIDYTAALARIEELETYKRSISASLRIAEARVNELEAELEKLKAAKKAAK